MNFNLNAKQKPIIKIPLNKLKSWVYTVQARCNLHWTWEDTILI